MSLAKLRGRRKGDIGIAMLCGVSDGLGTGYAGYPDGWVGLLQGNHPRVYRAELEVLALPAEGTRLCPSLDDEVMGLLESLPVVHWVDVAVHRFLADAPHEPADHASPGDYVDHGDLFCDAQRVLVDGEDVAQEDDLPLLGGLG